MFERWLQREVIHAIYRRDLERILKDIGLLDRLLAGKSHCAICGTRITLDTLQCLFMEGNQIRLCCTNIKCYHKLLLEKGTCGK